MEKQGRCTVDVPTKFQYPNNVFVIHTSPDAQYARKIEDLAKIDANDVCKDIKTRISARSWVGLRNLCKIFAAMDDGSHKLDVDDFRWGLIDLGLQVSKEESEELLKKFDADGSGKIHYANFLSHLRGNLNPER